MLKKKMTFKKKINKNIKKKQFYMIHTVPKYLLYQTFRGAVHHRTGR